MSQPCCSFSVAMATYNGASFLPEQLYSLARQTRLPHELVVVDDGSTDATVSILNDFAQTAPFDVRIYRNSRNLGYGETFLRAAALCVADWIAFCDQDDIWLVHKLDRCARVLAEHPEVVLLSHSADQVDVRLRPLHHRMPNHTKFSITGPLQNRPLSVLIGFTCCVRKTLLDMVPVNERPRGPAWSGRGKQPHDNFIYNIANTYGSIARLPESLVLYRRHEGSITGMPGTGVHEGGLRAVLQMAASPREQIFAELAEQAQQHRRFYELILSRAAAQDSGGLFMQRTHAAIDLYGRIAAAYQARAVLHASSAGFAARNRALFHNVKRGAYQRLPKGLGTRALARDLARAVFSW